MLLKMSRKNIEALNMMTLIWSFRALDGANESLQLFQTAVFLNQKEVAQIARIMSKDLLKK